MSFSKAALKRFNDNEGCAPPPGHYNVKDEGLKNSGLKFDKLSERFKENETHLDVGFETPIKSRSTSKENLTPRVKKISTSKDSNSLKEVKELEKQKKQLIHALNNKEMELSNCQIEVQKLEGLVTSLNKKKSIFEGEMVGKEKIIKQLNRKLDFFQSQKSNEKLEAEMKKLKSNLLLCKQQIEESKMKRVSLQCDLKTATEKTKNLQDANSKLEQLNKDIREHEDKVSEQHNKLQFIINDLRKKIKVCTFQLEEKTNEIDNIKSECKKTVKDVVDQIIEEQETLVEANEAKIEDMHQRITSLALKAKQLQVSYETLTSKKLELLDEKKEIEDQNRRFSHKIDEVEDEKREMVEKNESLSKKLEEKMMKLKDEVETNHSLQQTINGYENQIQTFVLKNSQQDEELDFLKNQVSSLQVKLDEKIAESAKNTSDLKFLNDQKEELLLQFSQLKESFEDQQTQAAQKEEVIERLQQDAKFTAAETNSVLFELNQCRKERECLSNLKNSLKVDLDTAVEGIDKMKKKEEDLIEKISSLKTQLKENSFSNQQTLDEFTKRILETQQRLNHREEYVELLKEREKKLEENFNRAQDELESCEGKHKKEIEKYKQLLKEKDLEINEKKKDEDQEEIEMWKMKYENLLETIGPFKKQLDSFAAEKSFLLNRNNAAEAEVSDLGRKYAELLGHQNQKQKIRHVVKLKDEVMTLRKENSNLKNQVDNLQKQAVKIRKPKFDPSQAFKLSKEKTQN